MNLRIVSDGDAVKVQTSDGQTVDNVRAVMFEWVYGQPPLAQFTVVCEADIGFDTD